MNRNELKILITEHNDFLDIGRYLKGRIESFLTYCENLNIIKGEDTFDALIKFELENPRFAGKKLRQLVLNRDNHQCVQCSCKENLQIDHIIPYSKGGLTSISNMQVLCKKCNNIKKDKIYGCA